MRGDIVSHPQNEACIKEFQRLREEIKESNRDAKDDKAQNTVDQKEVLAKIISLESSAKSAHHRISEMSKHTEAVIRLSVSVDNVVEQIGNFVKLFESHHSRITTLENRPAQTVYGYFQIGVVTLVTGLIGFFLGLILTNGGL